MIPFQQTLHSQWWTIVKYRIGLCFNRIFGVLFSSLFDLNPQEVQVKIRVKNKIVQKIFFISVPPFNLDFSINIFIL